MQLEEQGLLHLAVKRVNIFQIANITSLCTKMLCAREPDVTFQHSQDETENGRVLKKGESCETPRDLLL